MKGSGSPPAWKGYALASLMVGVALLVTSTIPQLGRQSPSSLFFAAVMVSSWYGGLGAGLLASALATIAIDVFVMPPPLAVTLDPGDLVRIAVFLLVALLTSSLNASRLRLAEELRRRAEELAEADRRKDESLAIFAHELRNPLAAVRGAAEAARSGRIGGAECTALWDMVDRQACQMTRLVDDLLDISRIALGATTLHKQPVDLRVIVGRGIETARSLIVGRRHELKLALPDRPVWVEGDPARLEQVVVNLLANAAKYTEPGGRIWVELEDEGVAELRVCDNGIGIAPEMLPRVFDLFYRAEAAPAQQAEGAGVGLALARSLVVLHGGFIDVRSAGAGRGTEFAVRLPTSPHLEDPARGSEPERAPPAGLGPPVLVVDDRTDTATSLARVLELWGYDVVVAYDGEGALGAARDSPPDAVLLDIELPGMDGYQVAERIRDSRGPGSPRLIALSGWQPEGGPGAKQEWFDAYLTKPVDFEALRELLDRLMPAVRREPRSLGP